MGSWAQGIIANMRSRIEAEAEQIGREMVEDIQQAISTPVVRDFSGFNVVQRSPEFSDPWLETGNLWRSQHYEVQPYLEVMELNVFNVAIYARRLNDGHGNVAPRPFNDFAKQRWYPVIPGRIGSAITRRS